MESENFQPFWVLILLIILWAKSTVKKVKSKTLYNKLIKDNNMGYLFKKTEDQDKTILELKTKNFYIFAIIVLLSLIPAVYLATHYFENNVNLLRIPYVLLLILIYAILDGKAIAKILFPKNKICREGSVFSFKNPVKYTIKKWKLGISSFMPTFYTQ